VTVASPYLRRTQGELRVSRHRPPHLAAALAALLSLSTLACEERAVLPEGTSCLRGLGEGIGGSAGTGSFKDCGPGMECRWEDTTCYRRREEGEACGPGTASNGKTALCGHPLRCVVDRPATCEGAACAGVCEKPFEAGPVCASSNDCAEGRRVFGGDGVGRCYVGRQLGSPCNADPFVGDAPEPNPELAGLCAGELVCQPPSLGVDGVACDPETEPGCRLLGICDLPDGEGAGAGCFSDEACPRGLVYRTPVDPPLRYDPSSGAYEAIHVPFRGGTCTPRISRPAARIALALPTSAGAPSASSECGCSTTNGTIGSARRPSGSSSGRAAPTAPRSTPATTAPSAPTASSVRGSRMKMASRRTRGAARCRSGVAGPAQRAGSERVEVGPRNPFTSLAASRVAVRVRSVSIWFRRVRQL
jgi:hypothetical protein